MRRLPHHRRFAYGFVPQEASIPRDCVLSKVLAALSTTARTRDNVRATPCEQTNTIDYGKLQSDHPRFFLTRMTHMSSQPGTSHIRAFEASKLASDPKFYMRGFCCMLVRTHMNHAHDHGDQNHTDDTAEAGDRVSRLGLLADICLTAGKGFAGYASGSTAVIADAAHSLSDVVSLSITGDS
ncbi:hypothetical protein L7F22_022168 [Adiantum nelumboides]|nr:hypothetical protein [Adiantum nelumboides]